MKIKEANNWYEKNKKDNDIKGIYGIEWKDLSKIGKLLIYKEVKKNEVGTKR